MRVIHIVDKKENFERYINIDTIKNNIIEHEVINKEADI